MGFNFRSWLNDRGITDGAISFFNITWTETRISIPIRDGEGNFLFNKYRMKPGTDGPKYMYDKGKSTALFIPKDFKQQLSEGKPVFICEGEFDAIVLWTKGFLAISSTGGAGSFKPEWNIFGTNPVYICYDNDNAGRHGAFSIQRMIPHAKILWIPEDMEKGADITDVFLRPDGDVVFGEMLHESISYPFPTYDETDLNTKAKTKQAIGQCVGILENTIIPSQRKYKQEFKICAHLDVYGEILSNEIAYLKKHLNSVQKKIARASDDFVVLKSIPIGRFITFNKKGYHKCVFGHVEKTASMYWYKQSNRVKCFGCGKHGDVIDVVCALYGFTVRDAINYLKQYV